ncbi:MAG: F0F1 ATP synthase subunit gamma, partial [Planctomycetaceae bacterium]
MAKARAIITRLKAVRNIRKITRTMELIATARFKRAMDRATEAAAYTRKINEIVADLAQADLQFSHALLKSPEKEERADLLI